MRVKADSWGNSLTVAPPNILSSSMAKLFINLHIFKIRFLSMGLATVIIKTAGGGTTWAVNVMEPESD